MDKSVSKRESNYFWPKAGIESGIRTEIDSTTTPAKSKSSAKPRSTPKSRATGASTSFDTLETLLSDADESDTNSSISTSSSESDPNTDSDESFSDVSLPKELFEEGAYSTSTPSTNGQTSHDHRCAHHAQRHIQKRNKET